MLLLKRCQTYYFRWQIPADLRILIGSRELVRSLHTGDMLLAEARAAPLKLMVGRIKKLRVEFAMAKNQQSLEEFMEAADAFELARDSDQSLTMLTENNRLDALKSLWQSALENFEADHEHIFASGRLLKAFKKSIEVKKQGFRDMLTTGSGDLASNELGSLGELVHDCQLALQAIGYRVDRSNGWPDMEAFLKEYAKLQGGLLERLEEHIQSRENRAQFTPSSVIAATLGMEIEKQHLFSEVAAEFIVFKRKEEKLSEKMANDYFRYYRDWESLMPDKPVGSYSVKEIKGHLTDLLKLPRRNKKPYIGLAASALLSQKEIPEEDFVTRKTVGQVEKWLQGVFKYSRDKEYSTGNPASGLGLKLNEKAPYSKYEDHEVRTMLLEANKGEGWKRAVIWIAAYTGMRLGEIVQLTAKDIKRDVDSDRLYFLVTDQGDGQKLKTIASKRQVVISLALIESGIPELDVKGGHLFPDLKAKAVTKWFAEVFRPACSISAVNDFGQRKVFHSFRHTVTTKLHGQETANLTKIQQLIGHERTDVGAHGNYIQTLPLKDLVSTMDSLDYQP